VHHVKILLNLKLVVAYLINISYGDCLILDKVFLSFDLRKFLADSVAAIS
jgi:hypothetical protein